MKLVYLLSTGFEGVKIIEGEVVLVFAGAVEFVNVILVVSPDALNGALGDSRRSGVGSRERREADISERVVVRRDDGLDALLQFKDLLQELGVEHRAERQ